MQTEAEVAADCDKLVRKTGGEVWTLSQPRHSMQTPGISDRIYAYPSRRVWFWFEVKVEGRKLSTEQIKFRDSCLAGGVWHFWGAVPELQRALQQFGILKAAA